MFNYILGTINPFGQHQSRFLITLYETRLSNKLSMNVDGQ